MTREQAEEIQRRLLDVGRALDHAREAIGELPDADRALFTPSLRTIVSELYFEMLNAITDRFPELAPAPEIPRLDSDLEWDEVSLPASVAEHDLDAMILSVLTPQWRKMAAVLTSAQDACKKLNWAIAPEIIAARIQLLAEDERIDHQGDLRKWRFSEVRLKP